MERESKRARERGREREQRRKREKEVEGERESEGESERKRVLPSHTAQIHPQAEHVALAYRKQDVCINRKLCSLQQP